MFPTVLDPLVLLSWFGEEWKHLNTQIPKIKSENSHPCVDLHREKLFQLPSNCLKLKFVSCTSNLLEQTYGLPKTHNVPPRSGFRIFKISRRSQSLESITHMTTLFVLTCVMNVRDQHVALRLSQALVHLVTARTNLFTDHKISRLPMRAKYKHPMRAK